MNNFIQILKKVKESKTKDLEYDMMSIAQNADNEETALLCVHYEPCFAQDIPRKFLTAEMVEMCLEKYPEHVDYYREFINPEMVERLVKKNVDIKTYLDLEPTNPYE